MTHCIDFTAHQMSLSTSRLKDTVVEGSGGGLPAIKPPYPPPKMAVRVNPASLEVGQAMRLPCSH